jgi:hypothetical protein
MFEMMPVQSSNIKAIGYDLEQCILYIEFKSGGLYAYKDVPKPLYEDLGYSESVGKFFFAHIKGKFECEKVDKEEKE